MIEGDKIPDECNPNLNPEDGETIDPEESYIKMTNVLSGLCEDCLQDIIEGIVIWADMPGMAEKIVKMAEEKCKCRPKKVANQFWKADGMGHR